MSSAGWAQVLIDVVGVLLTIFVLVPPAMVFLGLIRLRAVIQDAPARAEPTDQDPSYQRRFSEFASLGFRPAGAHLEVGWFLTPWDWRKQFLERWMTTPDGSTLASFHRLIPDEPVRFGAVTVLEGGCIVRTTCPGAGPSADTVASYRHFSLSGVEPAELLAQHQEHVAAVCRETGLTVRHATFSEAATLEAVLGQAVLKRINHHPGSVWGAFLSAAFLVLGILYFARGSLDHSDLAWAGAVASGAVLLLHRFLVRARFRLAVLASHSPRDNVGPASRDEPFDKSVLGRALLWFALIVSFLATWRFLNG